jgi:hypothetical protein
VSTNYGTVKVFYGPAGLFNTGTIAGCRSYSNSFANQLPAPGISPLNPAPTTASSVLVTLTDTSGLDPALVAIRYTTDGSTPTCSSPLYAGPFSVSSATTIKAIACATGGGWTASPVASSTISFYEACPPTITLNPIRPPSPGLYQTEPVRLTFTACTNVPGLQIRYTVNGAIPDASSPSIPLGGFIDVTSYSFVRASSFVGSRPPSAVVEEEIKFKVVAPVFSPPAGSFSNAPYEVTLTSATLGPVSIRYTTDGTSPSQSSPVVTNGGRVAN